MFAEYEVHDELVTPPATEPVMLAELESWLKLSDIEDAPDAQRCISAARAVLEQRTERALMRQTRRALYPQFPGYGADGFPEPLLLPWAPLVEVESIKYLDQEGELQVLAPESYAANHLAEPPAIWPAWGEAWPGTRRRFDAVQVTYRAGYAHSGAVPPQAKKAILMLAGHWFENRETVLTGTISKEIEHSFNELVELVRVYR